MTVPNRFTKHTGDGYNMCLGELRSQIYASTVRSYILFLYFYVFRSIHSLMLICQHLNNIKGKTQYVQYVH